MSSFSRVRRIGASLLAAMLLTGTLASAALPRNPAPSEDDEQELQMKKLIGNPAIAAKLDNVRKFGLDPHDPDLAKKLVPIAHQLQQQRPQLPASASTAPKWVIPPPHGTTYHFVAGRKTLGAGDDGDAAATKKGAPKPAAQGTAGGALTSGAGGGPLLVNGATPSGTAQAGPGDVLQLTGAGFAPGGNAAPITLNLGTCGSHTLTSSGVNQNGDGTQSVFVILPDSPNAILADKLLTPSTITIGPGTFNLMYQAPIAHFAGAQFVSASRVAGTRMSSSNSSVKSPLGFKEGVSADTSSGPDFRFQSLGLGMGGDDRIGTGIHLLHGFGVSAVRATLAGNPDPAVIAQVTQAPGPGAQTLDTTVHWGIGPTFFSDSAFAEYSLQWDLVGPLGARPIDSLPSYGACDVQRP